MSDMVLPEGYFSEENDSEEEGLSFPDEFPIFKKIVNINEIHSGEKLINAILDRKLELIHELINEGTDVNYSSENSGWTPLMYAASLGISEYTELLLSKGACPNVHYRLTTPLMCVCNSTCFDDDELLKCFNLLIVAGASINVCDVNKISPLMYASSRGHIQLVARLLELGSELEMRDNDGWTAIFFAVDSGDVNMVQLLKDSGSNISSVDRKGRTLQELAAVKNYHVITEIVSTEKKGFSTNIQEQLIQKGSMSKYDLIMYDMPDYNISDFNGFVEDSIKTIVTAGLANLATLFIEKKIGYGQFLIYKDEDWKEIGVKMSFDRKKLTSFSNRIIQKQWSLEAFNKHLNEKFTLFKLVEFISNSIRIIHILIATCYVCNRELPNAGPLAQNVMKILNSCIQELNFLKLLIRKLYSLIKHLDNFPPSDFIAPQSRCPLNH